MKVAEQIVIDRNSHILQQKDLEFVYQKRLETDIEINTMFHHFQVKYDKEELRGHDLNDYDYGVWQRFQDKRRKMDTMVDALKKDLTVVLSTKEHYFYFQEKPKLSF